MEFPISVCLCVLSNFDLVNGSTISSQGYKINKKKKMIIYLKSIGLINANFDCLEKMVNPLHIIYFNFIINMNIYTMTSSFIIP